MFPGGVSRIPSIQADVIRKCDLSGVYKILAICLPPILNGSTTIFNATDDEHQRNVSVAERFPDGAQVRYLLVRQPATANAVHDGVDTATALQMRLDRTPR